MGVLRQGSKHRAKYAVLLRLYRFSLTVSRMTALHTGGGGGWSKNKEVKMSSMRDLHRFSVKIETNFCSGAAAAATASLRLYSSNTQKN